MPRTCTVCTNERAGDIAKAILAGDSLSAVAIRYCLTKAAIQRHTVNCLNTSRRGKTAVRTQGAREAAKEGASVARFDTDPTLCSQCRGSVSESDRLFSEYERSKRVADECKQRGDARGEIAASDNARRALESYERLKPQRAKGPVGFTPADAQERAGWKHAIAMALALHDKWDDFADWLRSKGLDDADIGKARTMLCEYRPGDAEKGEARLRLAPEFDRWEGSGAI
jgi:hypothetical protein